MAPPLPPPICCLLKKYSPVEVDARFIFEPFVKVSVPKILEVANAGGLRYWHFTGNGNARINCYVIACTLNMSGNSSCLAFPMLPVPLDGAGTCFCINANQKQSYTSNLFHEGRFFHYYGFLTSYRTYSFATILPFHFYKVREIVIYPTLYKELIITV